MNMNRPSSRADNTSTIRHNSDKHFKSTDANHPDSRAVDNNHKDNAQASEFEKLLKDLNSGNKRTSDRQDLEKLDTDDSTVLISDLATEEFGGHDEDSGAVALPGENADSSDFESFVDNAEDDLDSFTRHTDETSESIDVSGMPQSAVMTNSEAGHSENLESNVSVSTTPAVNEAAARIFEEMQTRVRRNESRRWQFSLPGIMGGDVSVVVENTAGQSWNVQLSMPDGWSDEDRQALEERLAYHIDDVSLSIGALDE